MSGKIKQTPYSQSISEKIFKQQHNNVNLINKLNTAKDKDLKKNGLLNKKVSSNKVFLQYINGNSGQYGDIQALAKNKEKLFQYQR